MGGRRMFYGFDAPITTTLSRIGMRPLPETNTQSEDEVRQKPKLAPSILNHEEPGKSG